MVHIWETLAEKGDVMQYIVSVLKKVSLNFKNALHFENTIDLKLMCT